MMKLSTDISFRCPRFKPTPGELDEAHDEYINPGVFAKAAADFIAHELARMDYKVSGIIQEDWGRWVELDNPDGYFLAVGIANYDPDNHRDHDNDTHRLFVEPDKSPVRKWFRKIDTEARVMKLFSDIRQILEKDSGISDIKVGEV